MERRSQRRRTLDAINRCEELILKAKKTAREVEERIRRALAALEHDGPAGPTDDKPAAARPSPGAEPPH